MNADELAEASAQAYMRLKAAEYAAGVTEPLLLVQFGTSDGFTLYGCAGREVLGEVCEHAKGELGPILSVTFNCEATARPLMSMDDSDEDRTVLLTFCVVRDHRPAYRCWHWWETSDGLGFERADIDELAMQPVVLDLNRCW